jgi:hypothetical protein
MASFGRSPSIPPRPPRRQRSRMSAGTVTRNPQATPPGWSAQPTVMASSRSLMNADDVTGSSPETFPIGGASGVTTASWLAS